MHDSGRGGSHTSPPPEKKRRPAAETPQEFSTKHKVHTRSVLRPTVVLTLHGLFRVVFGPTVNFSLHGRSQSSFFWLDFSTGTSATCMPARWSFLVVRGKAPGKHIREGSCQRRYRRRRRTRSPSGFLESPKPVSAVTKKRCQFVLIHRARTIKHAAAV